MVNWDKETIGKLLSILLTAVIALLGVAGYHVVVVQPQVQALQAEVWALTPAQPAGSAPTVAGGACICPPGK